MKAKFVTAYVPLGYMPHRTDEEYRRYGHRLTAIGAQVRAFEDFPLKDCWMFDYLQSLPKMPEPETQGNGAKNTLEYHIVQHSKTQWMRMAYEEDRTTDILIWMDYAIFKDNELWESDIDNLLSQVNDETIAIPGFVGRDVWFGPGGPHWRFSRIGSGLSF